MNGIQKELRQRKLRIFALENNFGYPNSGIEYLAAIILAVVRIILIHLQLYCLKNVWML